VISKFGIPCAGYRKALCKYYDRVWGGTLKCSKQDANALILGWNDGGHGLMAPWFMMMLVVDIGLMGNGDGTVGDNDDDDGGVVHDDCRA
jgi:hypothetical protein